MNTLEAESIEIIREAVANARKPVMMYSIGKDSSVMLHLARKAFYPAPPPFPLLHVDTTWKFQAMYAHRTRMVEESGMKLISHTNPEGLAAGVNPFTHGSSYHTDVMKTQALKQALDAHGFDVVFGGARRDEEKSRAKERVFSFRAPGHRWDPKAQRPEFEHYPRLLQKVITHEFGHAIGLTHSSRCDDVMTLAADCPKADPDTLPIKLTARDLARCQAIYPQTK